MENIPPVLGLETCQTLNLVKRIHEIKEVNFLKNYNDIFEGIGCIKIDPYHLTIDKNIKPIINAPCKIPLALQEQFKRKIIKLEIEGIKSNRADATE